MNQQKGTYALISLGCPKNLVDSERMAGLLRSGGYRMVREPEGADLVVVNTCGFIDQAREESYAVIGEMLKLKEQELLGGVIVAGCDPGSPAGEAGLQVGDRILRLNEEQLTALSAEDLPAIRRKLAGLPTDRAATLEVERAGESLGLSLTPRIKGEVEGEEFECKGWQMTVKTINQFANPGLHFHRQQGVFISGVKAPGNAEASGLMSRDIIVKVDGQEITTLDELKQVYERLWEHRKEKNKVVVEVIRSGLRRLVVLDYSWEYEE